MDASPYFEDCPMVRVNVGTRACETTGTCAPMYELSNLLASATSGSRLVCDKFLLVGVIITSSKVV